MLTLRSLNTGKLATFEIDTMVAEEKATVRLLISETDTGNLFVVDSSKEESLMALVSNKFLANEFGVDFVGLFGAWEITSL